LVSNTGTFNRTFKQLKKHIYIFKKISINKNRIFGGVKLDFWGRRGGGKRNLPLFLVF
jgi:hypothetical protein